MTVENGPPSAIHFRVSGQELGTDCAIACMRWPNRAPLAWRGSKSAHGMGEHIGRYGETIDALTGGRFFEVLRPTTIAGTARTALLQRWTRWTSERGDFDLLVEDMAPTWTCVRETRSTRAHRSFCFGHGNGLPWRLRHYVA